MTAALSRLPAPAGGEIGYRIDGEAGAWLVLIHGWCGSAAHWEIIAPLLGRDRRVLSLSHPGFGGMAPPDAAGRTIRAMGAAVARLLTHLDIDGATLVGHSMGGPVATETAIAAPDRVAGLIGLDTLSDRDYYGRVPDAEIRRRRAAFAPDHAGNMRRMVDAIVHPATGETMRQSIADGMIAAAPAAFALDVRDDLFAWDAEERWPLVACPAMLLNSSHVARLAHPVAMPCFARTAVETYDSGHFPMIEAPMMIVEKLGACLQRLESKRTKD